MSDKTGIEWTDATWNPTVGCTKVSAGCDHCYAETFVNRFAGSKGFPNRFDDMLLRGDKTLLLPLSKKWAAPRRIFVNSLSDLFHDDVPDEYIARVWSIMAEADQHTFQVLTKRPGRMRSFLRKRWPIPLPNVWGGTSVEDDYWAGVRIPVLLDTPLAVRWLSMEPLLGPVTLDRWMPSEFMTPSQRSIDWVVVGGESGRDARPMHPDWARSLRDQCVAAGVPFLFKQWGEWGQLGWSVDLTHSGEMVRMGKKNAGRVLDGRTWDEYPAAAR